MLVLTFTNLQDLDVLPIDVVKTVFIACSATAEFIGYPDFNAYLNTISICLMPFFFSVLCSVFSQLEHEISFNHTILLKNQ